MLLFRDVLCIILTKVLMHFPLFYTLVIRVFQGLLASILERCKFSISVKSFYDGAPASAYSYFVHNSPSVLRLVFLENFSCKKRVCLSY